MQFQEENWEKIDWLLWNCETTFRRNTAWGTLSFNTMFGDSDIRVLISETLLAEVLATRKVTFQERNSRGLNASSSKGGLESLDRIRFRSHGGTGSQI